MPGRPVDDPQDAAVDRMMFGRQRSAPAANDAGEPDFLPPMHDDEADLLVGRSNAERRGSQDRRAPMGDRRKSPGGRRASEYVPLRDSGAARADDGRRGPLLLAGALLIVLVFAVVVWNAYSDGVQSDTAEIAPELSTSGAFKTPPRQIAAAPAPVETATVEPAVADLAGPPPGAAGEERPATPPPAEATTPPASKYTAPPPAPLKAPEKAPVTAPAQTASVKPAPVPAVAPPTAAAPPPSVQPAAAGAYKPAFQSSGNHVVQIAATSSEASASTEWMRLQKAHPDLLASAERFIQQADVNGRTVYRLRVGSFASKADAVSFCTAFKAQGGNCLPAVK